MPSSSYTSTPSFEIPSSIRHQLLLSLSPARLSEIISLAKDATIEDPTIDFLTAVKAIARCEIPRGAEAKSHDQDVEMTDWNEEMDEDSQDNGNTSVNVRVTRPHVEAFLSREGKANRYERTKCKQPEGARDDEMDINWQQRERMALKRAYAQAFTWWPHEKASKQQCESFLQKHSV